MWIAALAAVASLVVFLGGLRLMRSGLEAMAEGRLPALLHKLARTPTRGILTGAVVTALVQSSAAVTAVTVGLVAAASLSFRDALGIVLGANVGSTITPLILTLDLWRLAVPCLVVGLVLLALRRPRLHPPGMALLGFACIFIALQSLTRALHPLTTTQWFADNLAAAGRNPIWAMAVGCLASAVVQSSTATTVVTMALVENGAVPLVSGIAMVLGANVGTCFTSVIAAIGQPRAAGQVALAHVLLNAAGVLLFLPFIAPYSEWMTWLSPHPKQQIADAHSIFNIICTLAVWPAIGSFARLVERLLPEQSRT
ncbi:Na/Pi cotransporter family protein [Alicyclobacillus shizuokensis]|uniref:Na/Pi cotransporter family protein n=1 Tax=Alicyclobacillus shizuokensis TaxID=392014 RepID=UPI0008316F90|nr:Na/Pi symporter [Alicyclobacillus shizuokensis]MCL6627445.1 Na/Pi symporter [Alicyclobacillus shizuokensis]